MANKVNKALSMKDRTKQDNKAEARQQEEAGRQETERQQGERGAGQQIKKPLFWNSRKNSRNTHFKHKNKRHFAKEKSPTNRMVVRLLRMERVTRLELATSTLARWRSTR